MPIRSARAVAPCERCRSAGQQVWRAIWMHTASNGPVRRFGPAHVTDLPYWFNTLGGMPDFTPTRSEMTLADTMSSYLVAFAATGDPNHRGAPAWPRYDVETSRELNLDDSISVGAGFGIDLRVLGRTHAACRLRRWPVRGRFISTSKHSSTSDASDRSLDVGLVQEKERRRYW